MARIFLFLLRSLALTFPGGKSVSVSELAAAHANRLCKPDESALLRRRIEYDFKVYGFNFSTVATIVNLSIAIFAHSLFFLGMAYLSNQTRLAFMRSIEVTGLEPANVDPKLLHALANINPAERHKDIRAYLGIQDENWTVFIGPFLDFKLWANCAPRNEQQPSPGEAI